MPHGAAHPAAAAGLPLGPHPGLPAGMPAAGLLGFGAAAAGLAAAGVPPSGAPHPAAHPLLKPELHSARESVDVKRPGSNSNEERLVSINIVQKV